MTELLTICVLILIACNGFLLWYTNRLHDLITEELHFIANNATMIGKVQDYSYNTNSEMIRLFKQHLIENHHIYDESEDGYNGEF